MQKNSENGSVLILIFVAIVLFAALSFTVGNMMRGGDTGSIGDEKGALNAGEVIDYGRKLRQAVQSIRISNSCTDTDISFNNATIAGYAHTPVVSDKCKVFHTDGGAMLLVPSPAEINGGTDWAFGGRLEVDDVGTDCGAGTTCTELYAVLEDIKLPVCSAINDKLGITTPSGAPPQQNDAVSFTKFIGDYTWQEDIEDSAGDDVLKGKLAGCTETSAGGSYFFYQVLIVR